MKNRIKEIRVNTGLSMQAFGEKLEVSKGTVSLWESGERNISPKSVRAICKTYGINETWLLTGIGEMKAPQTKEQEIASIAADLFHHPDPFRQKLISMIAQLDENDLVKLKNFLSELSETLE